MRTNRTPDERNKWCLARERIDEKPKEYYRAWTTGESPPQMIALSKKLDEELLKKQDRYMPDQMPQRIKEASLKTMVIPSKT
jgi:hypothetical protein